MAEIICLRLLGRPLSGQLILGQKTRVMKLKGLTTRFQHPESSVRQVALPLPAGVVRLSPGNVTMNAAVSTFDGLPQTGFLRLKSIIAPNGPIPVSKSTWWAGVKDGRFPKPVKLGSRITVWRVDDIRALLENGAA